MHITALDKRSSAARVLVCAFAAITCVFWVFAVPSKAVFGVEAFDGNVLNQDGTAATQAGSHPWAASVNIDFNTIPDLIFGLQPDGMARNLHVELPPGLVGNPAGLPQCTEEQLNSSTAQTSCPVDSQVGVVHLRLPSTNPDLPVFNMVPGPGEPAAFAFNVARVPIHLRAQVRTTGDYGINVDVPDINQAVAFKGSNLTFWGVPADPSHDGFRKCPDHASTGCPAGISPRAFLTNPTSCTPAGVGLEVRLRAEAWGGALDEESFFSHQPAPNETEQVGPTGCELVPFEPQLSVTAGDTAPDTPTGLTVALTFPQDGLENPTGLATAHLKKAVVTLPDGMTINPAGAGGLDACSDDRLGLGTTAAVTCPDASKIGSAEATSPLLDEKLTGAVYIRSQNSGDPESGEMFRLALVLENKARGLSVRLPGDIRADARTGQLTATFDNNAQLPVSDIILAFKSGPRAPLATPATCGEKTVHAALTSWSGKTVDRQSTFTVDCRSGLGGFAPSFAAGAALPVAGALSPFTLGITKPDGNADINGLSMVLPTGLLAHLKGSLNTQVGTVRAFAGPGSNPFMLPGQVFLEGAYGDAPFSLRVVVPAKAGPFDLGTVEVRQRIYVDPIDAHVTVVSDPIPTIVKGVPVRLQRLDVNVDKPGFMVNPTSCAAKTIAGTLRSVDGQSMSISNRFQVGDCAALALKPKLDLTLSGKGQTRDGGHPAISATLTQPAGGANLKKVRVALPSALALDPDNSNSDGLCSFLEGSKPNPVCPASSVVGKATAVSPILNQPLSGPVYFVKNERKDPKSGRSIKTTPKLVIPLVGENGVKLTLTGVSSVPDNVHLVTTFETIPDAPVSSFTLDINGGKKGILVVSGADICKATQIADQQVDGQNGKAADADVYLQTPSCPTRIISKKITAKTVVLKIGGLGAGKVTVTGRGIRKTTKSIAKSTVATITAKRTGHGAPGNFKVKFTKAKAATAAR